MFGPNVQVEDAGGALMAEFWDCHRLDPKPVSDLRKLLEKHLGRGRPAVLLVDLSGVGFAGSAALGGFVGMRKLGVRVIFYNVEPTVREVFRLSHLENFFHFETDREAALASIQFSPAQPSLTPMTAASLSTSTSPQTRPAFGGAMPPLRRLRRSTG